MSKTVEVKKMRLENFRATEKREVMFELPITEITAPNNTGKTSLLDAWLWALTGKVSSGTSGKVKPYDDAGEPVMGKEPVVELVLEVDGKEHTFCKKMLEKWQKKRGAKPVYVGDKYEYELDGVKLKEKDTKEWLNNLGDVSLLSDIFGLVSLPWDERRTLLSKLYFDRSEDLLKMIPNEIIPKGFEIKADAIHQDLSTIAAGWRAEWKAYEAKAKEYDARKKETEEMVASLQEEVKPADKISSKLATLTNSIKAKHQELAELEAGMKPATYVLEQEWDSVLAQIKDEEAKIKDKERQLIETLEDKRTKAEVLISQNETSLDWTAGEIARLSTKVEKLRKEYEEASAEVVEVDSWDECPYCNSPLSYPARNALQAYIGHKVQERLEQIKNKGLEAKDLLTQLQEKKKKLKESLARQKSILAEVVAKIEELQTTNEVTPKLQKLQKKLATISKKIEAMKAENSDDPVREQAIKLEEEIKALEQERDALVAMQEKAKSLDVLRTMLEELDSKATEAYAEVDKYTTLEALAKGTLAKITEEIKDKINQHFAPYGITFAMFRKHKNGNFAPACDVYVNGVPWSEVNTSGQIAAGINIVQELQKAIGITMPVWIDNAESITDIPLEGIEQAIVLRVRKKEGDKNDKRRSD